MDDTYTCYMDDTYTCYMDDLLTTLSTHRLLTDHTREVYEMDGLLTEQLTEAYVKQEQKVFVGHVTTV